MIKQMAKEFINAKDSVMRENGKMISLRDLEY
jgi:hypothetical protein